MKFPTLAFALSFILVSFSFSQSVGPDAPQIKTIKNPEPIFPEAAKNYIYGDVVRVAVEVSKEGKVTNTKPVGPLIPCSNREDRAVVEIQNAAVKAAKATVFEPILRDGKPEKLGLFLSYQLPLPLENRPARVGWPRGRRLPPPTYSSWAKSQRISGSVELSTLIDEKGRVLSFSVISGHPLLAAGTFNAICGSEFEPVQIDGKFVKAIGKYTYNFVS